MSVGRFTRAPSGPPSRRGSYKCGGGGVVFLSSPVVVATVYRHGSRSSLCESLRSSARRTPYKHDISLAGAHTSPSRLQVSQRDTIISWLCPLRAAAHRRGALGARSVQAAHSHPWRATHARLFAGRGTTNVPSPRFLSLPFAQARRASLLTPARARALCVFIHQRRVCLCTALRARAPRRGFQDEARLATVARS